MQPWDSLLRAFGMQQPAVGQPRGLVGALDQERAPRPMATPEAPQAPRAPMSPQELSQVLGAGAAALQPLMGPQRFRPNTGQALAALGAGVSGARRGIDEQRQMDQFREMQMGEVQAKRSDAERQAAAQAAQQAELEQYMQTLPPEQAALLRAFGPSAGVLDRIAPKPQEPKLQVQTITEGGQQRQVLMDMNTGEIQQELGRAPRWQPQQAPRVDRYRTLAPEEASQRGLPPGAYQINQDTGQITRVGGSGEVTVPTADGRVIRYNPTTGDVSDITPAVGGFEPIRGPEGEAPSRAQITGQTVESGVGPGPRATSAIGSIIGGFVPGATDEETERAKAQLNVLERLTRDSLTISSRPSAWEQQQIQQLFANPDAFFESPARSAIKLQELRGELVNVYNDNVNLLQNPAVQGGKRAELMQSNNSLQRAIDMINVSDEEVRRMTGAGQGRTGTASTGVGWRIVD
jgi:hypothetical protein